MRLVKFLKYIRPDEAEKSWNRQDLREVWVDVDSILFVDKTTVSYYGKVGLKDTIVMRLNLPGKEHIEVEGTKEEVLSKIGYEVK